MLLSFVFIVPILFIDIVAIPFLLFMYVSDFFLKRKHVNVKQSALKEMFHNKYI